MKKSDLGVEIVQLGGGTPLQRGWGTLWSTILVRLGVHLYIVHCFWGGDPPLNNCTMGGGTPNCTSNIVQQFLVQWGYPPPIVQL